MSSAHRGDSRPAASSESRDAKPAAEPAIGSHMLDQILELTAGGSPKAGFVEPEDVRVLREVAKTLAGQPFSLAPVVVALIHAVLEIQFRKAGIPSATVWAMAEHIAETLYDDPPSRLRLEALWTELSKS